MSINTLQACVHEPIRINSNINEATSVVGGCRGLKEHVKEIFG